MPPVPRATSISPAAWSMERILRTTTGFMPILEARKSLVTRLSLPKCPMQEKMWTATVNLDEICIADLMLRASHSIP